MKLSVVIPVFNGEKFLPLLFVNLFETLTPHSDRVEVILVNDGSTDRSSNLIKEFSRISEICVICINQNNSGEGAARNAGIKKARGEYILFLDCDDYLTKAGVSHFVQDDKLEYDIFCYGYLQSRDDASRRCGVKHGRVLRGHRKDVFVLNRKLNYGIGSTYIKTDFLINKSIKFKNFKNGADNEFFRRVLMEANSIIEFNINNFEYILRPISARTNIKNRADTLAACDATWMEINKSNNPKKLRLLSAFSYHVLQEVVGLYKDFYRANAKNEFWLLVNNNVSVQGLTIKIADFVGYRQLRRLLLLGFYCYLLVRGRKK